MFFFVFLHGISTDFVDFVWFFSVFCIGFQRDFVDLVSIGFVLVFAKAGGLWAWLGGKTVMYHNVP